MTVPGFDPFASGKIRKLICRLMGSHFPQSGSQRHSQNINIPKGQHWALAAYSHPFSAVIVTEEGDEVSSN